MERVVPVAYRFSSGRFKSFTLVELLIVISIITILAVAVFALTSPADRINAAKDTQTKRNINQIAQAIEFSMVDNSGVLPTAGGSTLPVVTEETLTTNGINANTLDGIVPNYINEIPPEPDSKTYYVGKTSNNVPIVGAGLSSGYLFSNIYGESDSVIVQGTDAGEDGSDSGGDAGSDSGTGFCTVGYSVVNEWGNGFIANINVNNTSGADIEGWTVTWTFAGDQTITNSWDSINSQVGQNVSADNESYNSVIAAGGNVTFGFQATYSGTNQVLSSGDFAVNGISCDGAGGADGADGAEDGGDSGSQSVCTVNYIITDDWGVGFNTDVTVYNISDNDWYSWTVNWAFAGDQLINSEWNVEINQTGQNVVATNKEYNRIVTSGGNVNFGFQGVYTGTNDPLSPSGIFHD